MKKIIKKKNVEIQSLKKLLYQNNMCFEKNFLLSQNNSVNGIFFLKKKRNRDYYNSNRISVQKEINFSISRIENKNCNNIQTNECLSEASNSIAFIEKKKFKNYTNNSNIGGINKLKSNKNTNNFIYNGGQNYSINNSKNKNTKKNDNPKISKILSNKTA